jgi:hypothetical protein
MPCGRAGSLILIVPTVSRRCILGSAGGRHPTLISGRASLPLAIQLPLKSVYLAASDIRRKHYRPANVIPARGDGTGAVQKAWFAGTLLRRERRPSVRPSAELSFRNTKTGTAKLVSDCSRHEGDYAPDGRRTRSFCGNFTPCPIWQKNQPDKWLIECGCEVRLRVAVVVERRPKYQHKRFLSWGVRAWAKPVESRLRERQPQLCLRHGFFVAAHLRRNRHYDV